MCIDTRKSRSLWVITPLLFALAGTACNNEGEPAPGADASTGDAEIVDGNVNDLAVAATSGARAAIDQDGLPGAGAPITATAYESEAGRVAAAAAHAEAVSVADEALAAFASSAPESCPFGGTMTTLEDGPSTTTRYDECGLSEDIEYDGDIVTTVAFGDDSYTATVAYDDFCVTVIPLDAQRCFDGWATTVSCRNLSNPEAIVCTESNSFSGLDGRSYDIEDANVTGDDANGYSVSAKVTDPAHGQISIETTEPVVFDCVNGAPSQGFIQLVGGDATFASVEFLDCDTFEVCIGDACEEVDWADYGLAPEPD